MKENLVQKLDVLEVQLATARKESIEGSSKLARTKYILEKMEKAGQAAPSVKQLEQDIATTKLEIARRKIHYALTVIKRFLKQFKKVEPLRIAKRRKSAETPEKQKNLELEEELAKSLDIESCSNDILYRFLSKKLDIKAALHEDYEKRQLSPIESNIYGRIGKSKAIQDAQNQLLDSILPYFAEYSLGGATPASEASDNSAKQKRKHEETRDDFTQFDDEDNNTTSTDTAGVNTEENEKEGEKAPSYDPFFDQNVEIANSDDDSEEGEQHGIGAPPTLMQGFISGSEDEDEDTYVEPDVKPQRRNRRGQRARQKIWEQKYGKKANHVIKQQKEEEKSAWEKEQKRRRKEEKYAQAQRRKQEFYARPVHPSWEAKQKQKEQQEKIHFAGKRVKF